MAERISRDELRQLIREALREALGDAPPPLPKGDRAAASKANRSSPPPKRGVPRFGTLDGEVGNTRLRAGEAESARSAEPGEGSGAALYVRDPHPVASRLGLPPERRGGRAYSLASGILTEALVTKLAAGHQRILIGGEVVVTPLARERARMLKVEIVRQQP